MLEPSVDRAVNTADLAMQLLSLTVGNWTTQAACVAAELGLPDLLAERPQTSAELAAATGCHAPSLYRLLRALTTLELVREGAGGAFELTPLGGLLRSDAPGSVRSWARFMGGHQYAVWGALLHSVRTGESARKHLLGTAGFEHLAQDPALAALFNQTMREISTIVAADVARRRDFSGGLRLVDVGGGTGQLLATLLQANPEARGVLYDMDHAREAAEGFLAGEGLDGRCTVVAGDFFQAVPGPADVCLLKSILHDWDDELCRVILENCRRALAPGGRVLVIERLMPELPSASPADQFIARSDLSMLLGPGGRERTEAEFRALLAAAGLRLGLVSPLALEFSLLEAVPAAEVNGKEER